MRKIIAIVRIAQIMGLSRRWTVYALLLSVCLCFFSLRNTSAESLPYTLRIFKRLDVGIAPIINNQESYTAGLVVDQGTKSYLLSPEEKLTLVSTDFFIYSDISDSSIVGTVLLSNGDDAYQAFDFEGSSLLLERYTDDEKEISSAPVYLDNHQVVVLKADPLLANPILKIFNLNRKTRSELPVILNDANTTQLSALTTLVSNQNGTIAGQARDTGEAGKIFLYNKRTGVQIYDPLPAHSRYLAITALNKKRDLLINDSAITNESFIFDTRKSEILPLLKEGMNVRALDMNNHRETVGALYDGYAPGSIGGFFGDRKRRLHDLNCIISPKHGILIDSAEYVNDHRVIGFTGEKISNGSEVNGILWLSTGAIASQYCASPQLSFNSDISCSEYFEQRGSRTFTQKANSPDNPICPVRFSILDKHGDGIKASEVLLKEETSYRDRTVIAKKRTNSRGEVVFENITFKKGYLYTLLVPTKASALIHLICMCIRSKFNYLYTT